MSTAGRFLVALSFICFVSAVEAQIKTNLGKPITISNQTGETILVADMSYSQGDPVRKKVPSGHSTLAVMPNPPRIGFRGWTTIKHGNSARVNSATVYIVGQNSKARYFPSVVSGAYGSQAGVVNLSQASFSQFVDVPHGDKSYPGAVKGFEKLSFADKANIFNRRVEKVPNSSAVRYELLGSKVLGANRTVVISRKTLLTNSLNEPVLYAFAKKTRIEKNLQLTTSYDWRLLPSGESHYVTPGHYFMLGKETQKVYRASSGTPSAYIGGAIHSAGTIGGINGGHEIGTIDVLKENKKHGTSFSWEKYSLYYKASFQSLSSTRPNVIREQFDQNIQLSQNQSGQGGITLPKIPKISTNFGNNNFYRNWYVQYTTESQYSGNLSIRKVNGKTEVSGKFWKVGSSPKSYNSTEVRFPNPNTMVLKYRTETGYNGEITYTLAPGGQSASGKYDQNKYSLLTPAL